MKWRSILAILMMVGGLSTQAYAVVVLETDDNLAVLTGTWTQSTAGVGFLGTLRVCPRGRHCGHRSIYDPDRHHFDRYLVHPSPLDEWV
jgi:hypothetical protein